MKKTNIIIIILAISSIMFAYLYITANKDARESFGEKKEWGILQALEYDNRDKPSAVIKFEQKEKYNIVFVPSSVGSGVWIMLNPKNPPYYKQMPQIEYSLTPQEYAEIMKTGKVTSTVDICLQSHIKQ